MKEPEEYIKIVTGINRRIDNAEKMLIDPTTFWNAVDSLREDKNINEIDPVNEFKEVYIKCFDELKSIEKAIHKEADRKTSLGTFFMKDEFGNVKRRLNRLAGDLKYIINTKRFGYTANKFIPQKLFWGAKSDPISFFSQVGFNYFNCSEREFAGIFSGYAYENRIAWNKDTRYLLFLLYILEEEKIIGFPEEQKYLSILYYFLDKNGNILEYDDNQIRKKFYKSKTLANKGLSNEIHSKVLEFLRVTSK